MQTNNYSVSILVKQSPEEIYNAVCNVRGWWSQQIEGITNQLNEVWKYHYQDAHLCTIKTIALTPHKLIVWEVLDNHFSFTQNKNEWIGNQMTFDITSENDLTKLTFTQKGLTSEYECFDICSNAWDTYIKISLFQLITTGKGAPNAIDSPQTEFEKSLTSNFTTTFFVDASPKEAFDAINNVSAWWQGDITGLSHKEGDEFDYRMKEFHYSKQKLVELIPFERIAWLITESNLSFVEHKSEWTGTKVVFDITSINNKTQVRFTHYGLIPTFECYDACSNAWHQLVQESLVSLINTGKGKNVFG